MENNSPIIDQFSRIPSMNANTFTPFILSSQEKQPSFMKKESIPTSHISLFKPAPAPQVPTEMKTAVSFGT
jgi:hypothetical protein